MSKLRCRTPPETDRAVILPIVDALFPTHPPFEWPAIEADSEVEAVPPITSEEVISAVARMASSKAPGLDGIPNSAVKAAVRQHPEVFARIFNDLLQRGDYPRPWKKARLVLIAKPGKPPGEASSYRPLLMLGSVSKVFERLILNRLNEHLEDTNNTRLSPSQYGFRQGRSTVQAIQRVVEQGQHARSFHRTNRRDPRCLVQCPLATICATTAENRR